MHSYHSICTLLYRFSINFEHGSVKLTCTCCNFVFNHRFGKRKSGSLPLSSPMETSKKHLGFSFSDILAKNSAEKYWGHKWGLTRNSAHEYRQKNLYCHMCCVTWYQRETAESADCPRDIIWMLHTGFIVDEQDGVWQSILNHAKLLQKSCLIKLRQGSLSGDL